MPARLLREGILDSEAVNKLSFEAEVFYRRLMSVVDDFGRFDGRPIVLRSRLYPTKVDSVRVADISRWLAECETAGLLVLYAVEAKPYILFHKLGQPRAKESKFPAPPTGTGRPPDACAQVKADESKPAQVLSDAPYSYSTSDTTSGSGTDTTAGRPPEVGRSEPRDVIPFDPMRHDEQGRKLFEQRWRDAKLRKFSRLDKSLWLLLSSLLADSWWAENYPAALAKASTLPFLQEGAGRINGALDVSQFLRDPDMVRKILDGVYDPRGTSPATIPLKPTSNDAIANMIAAKRAERQQKPSEGTGT
jgi:hypothetical protein